MKKGLIAIILLVTIITSCRKDDKSAFEKSPDERLTEKLAEYQALIAGAQNGWKGLVTTDSGKGTTYSFYFKFTSDNRVKMLSDFDSLSSVTLKESSYRLKALQQPSLIFDTYSYLHVLSDPDETVSGGVRGAGLQSDFEFFFDTASADKINLIGRFNGSQLKLTRATQAEETAYTNGALATGLFINKILTYFKRLTIGSQAYDINIDPANRLFTFTWLDIGGNLKTFVTGYYFTAGGILFTSPLINGSQTISEFSNMTWNPANEILNLTVNNTPATISGIVVPVKVDLSAPKRWWDDAVNAGNTYWLSEKGFHVNGVDDAFGLGSLTSGTSTYFFLLYWPSYAASNDFMGPVFLNAAGTALSLVYGTAPRTPTFTADGRAIFVQLGNYGTYPSGGSAAQTRNLLYNSSGYYFVQTSATSYDMVSALDGKSWITWER